jgi:hypothetical protein
MSRNYKFHNPRSSGYIASSQRLVRICNRRLTGLPTRLSGCDPIMKYFPYC